MVRRVISATTFTLCFIGYLSEAQTAVAHQADPCVPPHKVSKETLGVSDTQGRNVRWDPILKQSWIVSTSVKHPERPAFASQALQVEGTPRQSSPSLPIVHAGDVVRLWRQQEHVRMELTAVSEDNGVCGERVHLRLSRADSSGSQANQQFIGIVRGTANVEIRNDKIN